MGFLRKNCIWSLTLCLNFLKIFGIYVPGDHSTRKKVMLRLYAAFWYIYINGIYILMQAGDLMQIWGQLTLMVSTSFLLFTNLAFGMKIINVLLRKKAIQQLIDEGNDDLDTEKTEEGIKIIQRCNQETSRQLYVYYFLSMLTVSGWVSSAETGQLPLRAWYPYDERKSPAFELTYFHQATALFMGATLHVCVDTLAVSLIALCRCRLKLVNLSLENLCKAIAGGDGIETRDDIILPRLKDCVRCHQAVLRSAGEVQHCFSECILAQFTVSMVIICVTAYQLAVEIDSTERNAVMIVGMIAYLFCMILQVFFYCYQGHQLMIESTCVATAAYSCPWYACSLRVRRGLLVVMTRSNRETCLTAGGLTTLSLTCFTAIVKASYTFFTVLKRVEDRQK